MNIQRKQDLLNAKLTHYNKWLGDAKRQLADRYPGFPQQRELDVLCGCAEPIVEPVVKAKRVAKTVEPKVSGGKTKLEQAKALFTSNRSKSRGEMIELFQTKLGMSKAGATTYWYSAQK